MNVFWSAFLILALHSLPAYAQPLPGQTYGPTTAQDTLWSIASRIRPSNEVSVQQMVLALYQNNPQAFSVPNINALNKGRYLQMPSTQLIQKLSYQQAKDAIKQHDERWSHNLSTANATSGIPQQRSKNIQIQNQQLADQQKQIDRLQNQIKKLRAQLSGKNKTIRGLRSQVRQANQRTEDNSQNGTITAQLRKDNKELNERLEHLQTLLDRKLDHLNPATLEGKNLQLERQLLALQTGTAITATTAKAAENNINPKTQTELQALQTKLDESEAAQKTMATRVEQLEGELNKQHTRVQQLKETLRVASDTLQKQQAQNKQMYERLQEISPESAKAFAPAEGSPRLELKGLDELTGSAANSKANSHEANTQKNVLLLLLALFLLPILLLLAWLFHSRRKKARVKAVRQQKLRKQKEQRKKDERDWIKSSQQPQSTAMAEADLYMSYGDYTQALAVILNAIHADPIQKEYKVKHLEILQKTGNREAFDSAMLKYWEELMTTRWRDDILAMQKSLHKKTQAEIPHKSKVTELKPVLAANANTQ